MLHSSPNLRSSKIARGLAASAFLALVLPLSAATYVGSETCRNCHFSIYKQVTNSIHTKMIRKVNPEGTIPSSQLSMKPSVSNIHGNLSASNAPSLSEVTYVMGGWYKEESYIKEGVDTNTGLATFRVTKYEWDPIKQIYHNNRDETRNWLTMCAGCHTTGYNPATQSFSEVNISCEACHGPGSEHARTTSKSFIVKDTSNEGCGFCHIRAQSAAMGGFTNKQFNFPIGYQLGHPETLKFIPQTLTDTNSSFFPDGTSKRHRQQYLDVNYPGFRTSKHHEKNVTCTSCHDPHTSGIVTVQAGIPAAANAPTNGVYGIPIYDNITKATNFVHWDGEGLKEGIDCASCHKSVDSKHVHYFTEKSRAASVSCVDCHMPDVINVNGKSLRGALHTHTFRSMRPETSMKYGADAQANSCTYRCHQDRGTNKTERAQWAAGYLQSHLELLALTDAKASLHLTGLRGFTYTIEGSADLVNWTPLGAIKADDNGQLHFQDESAPGTYRFYRAVEK